MKTILLLTFSFLILSFSQAQEWQVYNTSNSGIPANTPWEAVSASDGSMWFGMKGSGLTHLDNGTWTTYDGYNSGIAMDGVLGVNIDANDKIWLTLNSYGLQTFDGANWVTPDGSSIGVDFSQVYMRVLVNYLGDVYVGTNYGLAIYDGSNWSLKNMDNSNILDIHLAGSLGTDKHWDVAPDGTIWYERDQIVYSFNPITDVANSYDADDHGIVNWWNTFEAIFVDQNNILWIGVEQIGLITFDGTTWSTVENNPLNRVVEIGEDSYGNLWFTGGMNTSIIKFDKNSTFTEFEVDGINVFSYFVTSITGVADGNVWFTYDGSGAVLYISSGVDVTEHDSNLFNLYPNPTKGIVNIDNVPVNTPIQVFNIYGQSVKKPVSNQIDLSNLDVGIYFIVIENKMFKVIKK